MKKIVLPVIFLVIFLIPIGLIVWISRLEAEEYKNRDNFKFVQMAYGDIFSAERGTLKEYFDADGRFVSAQTVFIELGTGSARLRPLAKTGDEISAGQTVAYSGEREIKSPCNGIVRDVVLGAESYISVEDADSLLFECLVGRDIGVAPGDELDADGGLRLRAQSVSFAGGASRKVRFAVLGDAPDFYLDQELSLRVYTGYEYPGVLMLPASCVYQKDGDGYFVRTVGEDRYFLEEVRVEIGYRNSEYVSVTGIAEGTSCDSGYGRLFGAGN